MSSSSAGPAIDLTGDSPPPSQAVDEEDGGAAAASDEKEFDIEADSEGSDDEEGLPTLDVEEVAKMKVQPLRDVLRELQSAVASGESSVPKKAWKVAFLGAYHENELGLAGALSAALARMKISSTICMNEWCGFGNAVLALKGPSVLLSVDKWEVTGGNCNSFIVRMGPDERATTSGSQRSDDINITGRLESFLQQHFPEGSVDAADVFHRTLDRRGGQSADLRKGLDGILQGVFKQALDVLVNALAKGEERSQALAAEMAAEEDSRVRSASKRQKTQEALDMFEAIVKEGKVSREQRLEEKEEQQGPRRSSRAKTKEEREAQEVALQVQDELAEETGRPLPSARFDGLKPDKRGRYI